MTYSVYQHWDPLKVCAVGKSYSPEFYKFITNTKIRTVFEKIAEETEEDYQKLIYLLESFGVEVIRPTVSNNYLDYLDKETNKILQPPMTPRDYTIMLGEDFYIKTKVENDGKKLWEQIKGTDWPDLPTESQFDSLPQFVKDEIATNFKINKNLFYNIEDTEITWSELIKKIKNQKNIIKTITPEALVGINAATYTRIGRDIYVGTEIYGQDKVDQLNWLNKNMPKYRWHIVDTGGHSDSTFCPVKPGLIVSLYDIPSYTETFPDWEVVYLPGQSWEAVAPFLDLKEKNKGKWWVPGEELNDEFTNFVETWLGHWVGFVEETVFDVNMLVIDEKNVIVNNENDIVFEAFNRHGITPHVCNFRHRYFWDGGLHCITSDIHREGPMKDYFPERS
jgi:N-dimethylarginine dimethylaminohydrolase